MGLEDAGVAPDPSALVLGQFATGTVTTTANPTLVLALAAGDEIRLSAFAVRGDLQPAAFVSLDGAFFEPTTYAVGDQQVVLNFNVVTSGNYDVVVQPHQGIGEGDFLLRTECTGGSCLATPAPSSSVRILAINDFHGNVEEAGSNAGGAAYLAAHVQSLRDEVDHTLFVSAGDLVGASPFISARFHDEPAVEVMNAIGLDLTSVGNHEFDEGPAELLRLLEGGCHPDDGCEDGTPFAGASFDVLAANVETTAGAFILPSYKVVVRGGLPIAVIGMTLEGTRSVTVPSAVEDLVFRDEVETVNALVPELQAMGIETIVVVVHEGGRQDGDANDCVNFTGRMAAIATDVNDAVDVFLTGHSHTTYNCVIDNKTVTSAGASGRWITSVDVEIDGRTRESSVVDTFNHRVDHSLAPDAAIVDLVARYRDLVNAEENVVVGQLAGALNRSTDDTGESTLGLAIADSQLFATETSASAQIAFMNRGGIRADLPAGDITYGQAFAVQPFENALVTMTLSGQQLKDILDDQFAFGGFSVLQPSASLTYRIETDAPGVRIVPGSIAIAGFPLGLTTSYRVTVSSFIAEGGDGHPGFAAGTERDVGVIDSDAFVSYLQAQTVPLAVPVQNRITFE